jgi:energy-coupling factor transporter ATP-binding protein EcfA2
MDAVTTGADTDALLAALDGAAARVTGLRLPLELDRVEVSRRLGREISDQLVDYVLPRLRRIDAPLLAVVGGPTGAGKSTLVNSLVGTRITAAGVLRPTTRSAVLAYHPQDAAWFGDERILPGLERTTESSTDPSVLQLVRSAGIPAGLAVLDAPDIDSVVAANRDLATQLLAAADMWVFVTTAARYADAVPWDFLRRGATRGTAVAVVLDRVPAEGVQEVRAHLAAMLTEHGLGGSPLFVVPETAPVDGLLPDEAIGPLREWLVSLAGDAAVRAAVVRHTLDGAIRSMGPRLYELAAAADEQAVAVQRLRAASSESYAAASARVEEATGDGSLLRGEVLARWQEFVGTGELMRSLEARVGRVRDRVTAAVKGAPAPGADLTRALESGLESLVLAAADEAAERTAARWETLPAGTQLLDAGLRRSSPDLRDEVARTVREWQQGVLDLVRRQGQGRRATARYLALGVNGAGVLVMVVVFAHTGGLVAGEVAVAGGASAISQKILEAVLGDQAVRGMAATARADLQRRVDALFARERRRYEDALAEVAVDDAAGAALRQAAQDLEEAR